MSGTNMAVSYVRAVRTAMEAVEPVLGRWLHTQTPGLCHYSRLLHVSSVASRTEPQESSGSTGTDRRGAGEEEPEEKGNKQRRWKNPMHPVALAWLIGLPGGIASFFLVKRHVDKNRLKQLKIRQRMKNSNQGEYEGGRHLRHRKEANMNR